VLALLWTVAGTVVAGLTLAGVAAALARAGEAARQLVETPDGGGGS
jgi:hypothetical protein